MLHELLIDAIAYIVPLTELLGVAVVTWGSVHGLILLMQRGWDLLCSREPGSSLRDIRIAIGEKMALGLDFFLAGDIIQTIMIPSWESLAILGGIVVIRTVIAFFLNKDLRELSEK